MSELGPAGARDALNWYLHEYLATSATSFKLKLCRAFTKLALADIKAGRCDKALVRELSTAVVQRAIWMFDKKVNMLTARERKALLLALDVLLNGSEQTQ